jgi:DNA polymerase III delta prime subunit
VSKGNIGVNRVCDILDISKATYYNIKNSSDSFIDRYSSTKSKVEKTIKAHRGYGIRRIKKTLLDEYIVSIGRDTLRKLLVLWGLSLNRKVKKRKRSIVEKILISLKDKVNLLTSITLSQPFQAVSSDITKIRYADGSRIAYLCTHKDIVGHS